ncbi:MAG: hypothetical protein H0X17_11100, partial [Deltaproteobacteria bacterium]|nr:hypothetical protein [Deltaproteobacteria bacterium]
MSPTGRALRAVGAIDDADLARHAAATRLATLEDVLRAGGHVLSVIVQDEYTHDVVVTFAHAGGV